MLTELDVVRFFANTWPTFCPGRVAVELQARAKSCPFVAVVAWDRDTWRILAPMGKEPRELLELLYHEAHHVKAGEVLKTATDSDWAVYRGLMRGDPVPVLGARATRSDARASVATVPARVREDAAWHWAAIMAVRWWPTLRDWQDGQQAARVAWWVHNQKQGVQE